MWQWELIIVLQRCVPNTLTRLKLRKAIKNSKRREKVSFPCEALELSLIVVGIKSEVRENPSSIITSLKMWNYH